MDSWCLLLARPLFAQLNKSHFSQSRVTWFSSFRVRSELWMSKKKKKMLSSSSDADSRHLYLSIYLSVYLENRILPRMYLIMNMGLRIHAKLRTFTSRNIVSAYVDVDGRTKIPRSSRLNLDRSSSQSVREDHPRTMSAHQQHRPNERNCDRHNRFLLSVVVLPLRISLHCTAFSFLLRTPFSTFSSSSVSCSPSGRQTSAQGHQRELASASSLCSALLCPTPSSSQRCS
ncbi:hypothetical protein MPTK1_7g03260 [Marchantia polymorpha subsp. ruderalis]|uniref:Uncharacterized protein n=2 Tax=Marchantia polymorpha TaxID=3197 RepID=A0AAF6BVN6_MARPO|nr:hypothetical protein MARPO_0074s0070 [Marchantia polymorpha]BBN16070.1 hypothetical protein Mp_7g03260 [Marchantia polymorpha subsp. ruderalis]|eukprot:PTQ35095.1 hypothetical protein MARPO_0074s0070 [Marchantia polymorpha]